jgi:hypothetical protein
MRFQPMIAVVSILATLVSTSCITTRKNLPRPPTASHIAELKQALENHGGWVEHYEHGQVEISYLSARSVAPDGAAPGSLVLLVEDPPRAIPFRQVDSVWIRDRTGGAVRGVVAGAGIGLLSGLTLIVAADSAYSGWGEPSSASENLSLVLTAGLAGALIGAIVGVSVGKRTQFRF